MVLICFLLTEYIFMHTFFNFCQLFCLIWFSHVKLQSCFPKFYQPNSIDCVFQIKLNQFVFGLSFAVRLFTYTVVSLTNYRYCSNMGISYCNVSGHPCHIFMTKIITCILLDYITVSRISEKLCKLCKL